MKKTKKVKKLAPRLSDKPAVRDRKDKIGSKTK